MQVFISHSSKDDQAVRTLSEVLARNGLEVWHDSMDLLPGDNFASKIADGLKSSDAMVVWVTPESAQSEWIQREVEYALGDERYEGRLIPVLVGNVSPAQVPWIIRRQAIHIDAPEDIEQSGVEIARVLRDAA